MSKKDFRGGLDSLIPPPVDPDLEQEKELIKASGYKKETRGRPKTSTREITKSSQDKCREGESRATFIVNEDLLERVKDIAYWEGYRLTVENKEPTTVMIKDVINSALQEYVDHYTKKHGTVKQRPLKK